MGVIRGLERITDLLAAVGAFLVLPLIAAMVYEVFSRYVLGSPTFWSYEIGYMLMATIFMFGMAYALKTGNHVSVDFVYGRLSPRKQAIINLLGYGFLIPCLIWLSYSLFEYALRAYETGRVSGQSAWNPVVWPYRTVLFVGFSVLSLQLLIEFAKSLHALFGGRDAEA